MSMKKHQELVLAETISATRLMETCRVYKKTEQICNRSQRREAAQSMKFFINLDCLGTYDVE